MIIWHANTVRWWREVWRSPFSGEFMPSDISGGLAILADLYDRYWHTRSLELEKEIRLSEARFGLDVMARRRLQWEQEEEPSPSTSGDDGAEPETFQSRDVLRALK